MIPSPQALRSFIVRETRPAKRISSPVLLVGSAPEMALPSDFSAVWSVATVNASQASLPAGMSPNYTLFGTAALRSKPVNQEARHALKNRKTGRAFFVAGNSSLCLARARLLAANYSYESLTILTREERAHAFASLCGIDDGLSIWPSNGIAFAFLLLHQGAQKIVMTGFSLSAQGHSYNDKGRPRLHAEEDREILRRAGKKGLEIWASDPRFAEESGLPHYESRNS